MTGAGLKTSFATGLAALGLVLGFVPAVHAQAKYDTRALSDEMAAIFATFCIDRFPDDRALDTDAKAKKLVALTPDQVKRYLHDDPGRGWSIQGTSGRYVMTVEAPPYHACAVRSMTPAGLTDAQRYAAEIKDYAAKKGDQLSTSTQSTKTPDGIDINAYVSPVTGPAVKAQESFMLILSNYHGKVPAEFRADAKGGIGVEVRMVHQVVAQ
jgi:hypothetical protein